MKRFIAFFLLVVLNSCNFSYANDYYNYLRSNDVPLAELQTSPKTVFSEKELSDEQTDTVFSDSNNYQNTPSKQKENSTLKKAKNDDINYFTPKIQPDRFEDILPKDLKYEYKEPIERPKWAYPLAWIGWVGTCLLIPFPLVMKKNDNAIEYNNKKHQEMKNYEKKYYSDIDKCNTLFKTNEDLYRCYQDVKLSHQTLLNNIVVQNMQAIQIQLQKEQLRELEYNNQLLRQKEEREYYEYQRKIYGRE